MSGMTKAAKELLAFLERIERLEEERKTLADDIADVYKELASQGYDKDATKVIVKIRRGADALNKWQGKTETVDLYLCALGMIPERDEDRAPVRTRENIEEFDAETGEIANSQSAATPLPADMPETEPQAPLAASGAHSAGSSNGRIAEFDSADAGSNPAPATKISDDDVPAFLKRDFVLRPHCLHPDLCAGSGSNHCYQCKKVMAESEAA